MPFILNSRTVNTASLLQTYNIHIYSPLIVDVFIVTSAWYLIYKKVPNSSKKLKTVNVLFTQYMQNVWSLLLWKWNVMTPSSGLLKLLTMYIHTYIHTTYSRMLTSLITDVLMSYETPITTYNLCMNYVHAKSWHGGYVGGTQG